MVNKGRGSGLREKTKTDEGYSRSIGEVFFFAGSQVLWGEKEQTGFLRLYSLT